MYDLRGISAREFVEMDPTPPRFQRALTWTPRQKFNFAISLYRGFPLGMVVLRTTKRGRKETKSLIDGRQRYRTLEEMRQPDHVYLWAKAALRLGKSSDKKAIQKYEAYMARYFGDQYWESEEELTPPGETPIAPEAANATEAGAALDEQTAPRSKYAKEEGLSNLLRLILEVHRDGKGDGFVEPFDFSEWIEGVDYLVPSPGGGSLSVSPDHLRVWVSHLKDYLSAGGVKYPPSQKAFLDYLLRVGRFGAEMSLAKARRRLSMSWPRVRSWLEIIEDLDRKMGDASLGLLDLRAASLKDEAKIFWIINSAGTPLTPMEILAATPLWSEGVANPASRIAKDTSGLYEYMEISVPRGSVVRWDIPATLLDRLEQRWVLGDGWTLTRGTKKTQFDRKLTLGFRIFTGFHVGAISTEEMATLPQAKGDGARTIQWGSLDVEDCLNRAIGALNKSGFFKKWGGWELTLVGLMTEAVAMNFLLLVSRNWEKRGRPTSPRSSQFKAFSKDAVSLLDRSILEYVSGLWQGAGDTRIAENIEAFRTGQRFKPGDKSAWQALLKEVIDEGTLEGRPYGLRPNARMKILLHYVNVINKLKPLSDSLHVDHIIPEAAFTEIDDPDLASYRHHIINLQLLPGETNRLKSDHYLREVPDLETKREVSRFSMIRVGDFEKYSAVGAAPGLARHRGAKLKRVLTQRREALVNDPGSFFRS